MSGIRVQGNADGTVGNVEDTMFPQTREQGPGSAGQGSTASVATYRINSPKVRVTAGPDGLTSFEVSQPSGVQRAATAGQSQQGPGSAGQGITVRSAAGPVSLATAGPKDVVTFPGFGDTSVEAAVTMGKLQPRANGQGYEVVGGQGSQNSQPAAQQQPAQEKPKPQQDAPAGYPGDLRGVQGTSAVSDAVLATMQTQAPAALNGVIESIARGEDPSAIFQDAGRQLQDEGFAGKASAMHAEFLQSGRQVLVNAGVEEGSLQAFQNWAQSGHSEAASDAIRDLVTHRSVARLADLGRRFVAESNTRIVTALNANNVETMEDNGTIFVSRQAIGAPAPDGRGDFAGSSQWISLREAIRAGYIEING
jgi:hypothetical protein